MISATFHGKFKQIELNHMKCVGPKKEMSKDRKNFGNHLYCLRINLAAIKHHGQKTLGKDRVYLPYTSSEVRTGIQTGQELGDIS